MLFCFYHSLRIQERKTGPCISEWIRECTNCLYTVYDLIIMLVDDNITLCVCITNVYVTYEH